MTDAEQKIDYADILADQIREKLKEHLNLTDEEFDCAIEEGRLYPTSNTTKCYDREDIVVEYIHTFTEAGGIGEIMNEILKPEEIIQKRKENEERIISFRKNLNESLYSLCEKSTGHDWWEEWKDTSYFDVGGEFHREFTRECRLCHKRETKKD